MNRTLSWLGIGITVAYLSFVMGLFSERPTTLIGLPANELGDFLAGVFGPLAVLWLILGFFQQGLELQMTRDSLKLQTEELKKSVEQQAALVEVSKHQLEEQRQTLDRSTTAAREAAQPYFVVNSSPCLNHDHRECHQLSHDQHGRQRLQHSRSFHCPA